MDFPINIGSYKAVEEPNKPMVLTMMRMPTPSNINDEVTTLLKIGRYELLKTSLDEFKLNIKKQLEDMFMPYGFDYEKDVAFETINRWGHGYTYEGALSRRELKEARRNVDNIYFANADSAGVAYSDASINMANKAVEKIKRSVIKNY